ncbi:hypothetical protein TYRP_000756 [Tyrophagus putrescentiae]|nr:hypothetical protein TYRP_000756 [Tyrophagus putrescentiae]
MRTQKDRLHGPGGWLRMLRLLISPSTTYLVSTNLAQLKHTGDRHQREAEQEEGGDDDAQRGEGL